MNFKDMKIEINEQQPLDDVVAGLERLGYRKEIHTTCQPKSICTYEDGTYHVYMREAKYKIGNPTTLAKLKEM